MIRVEADPANPQGGYARITMPGMSGRSVSAVAIGREGYGSDSLGPDGWQVASARLVPDAVSDSGGDLVVILGPGIIEHLEAGPLRFALPELGLAEVVMWPDIAPLPAAARGGFAGVPRPPPARPPARPTAPPLRGPEPLPAPDSDATVVLRPTTPVPPEAPKAPSREADFDPSKPVAPGHGRAVMLVLLLLIALAGAGGAAWWYREPLLALFRQPAEPLAPTPPPVAVEAPPAAVDDGIDRMTPAEIAALNLPPARVLAIAAARQAAGRHQDTLLLLEVAANAPYGPAMSALARLYDPATFIPGGALSVPNAAKAAQYWRAAELAGDPAAAPARAALRTRLEASAAAGDALAAIALQDNWP
ncbi:hypothetical protein C8P66_10957 [Humitalea rosea]|uniref:Uncharacterized protein n=1 Tax=Humitalea rosea TaxID=990373 RepID=A0A2W7IIB6_9PROT|nr:hypothetical protein [Humitalea rosea]PZW46560.1 hypothetical protein C8P66_10957 [Humitalea rosea]